MQCALQKQINGVKNLLVIGVTGQTGAGKGAVCESLRATGCVHIDADKLVHSIYEKDTALLRTLALEFGAEILNRDGALNRKALAGAAFASPERTEKLNSIVHPAVTSEIRKILKKEQKSGTKSVIIDAIALFESGEDALCDFTAAVTAPEEIRKARIKARDGLTEAEALLRIHAQKEEAFYTGRADIVVRNYPPYKLNDEVEKILLWINEKQ